MDQMKSEANGPDEKRGDELKRRIEAFEKVGRKVCSTVNKEVMFMVSHWGGSNICQIIIRSYVSL